MVGSDIFEPFCMLVFRKNEGPGKAVPITGLEIGLFGFQPDRG
jgi:hypothetical protein